jgi:hypothetical protein
LDESPEDLVQGKMVPDYLQLIPSYIKTSLQVLRLVKRLTPVRTFQKKHQWIRSETRLQV